MAGGHLTCHPDGHLTREAQRSPDLRSGGPSLRDALDAFLIAGQARGLSPKTLAWYRMIGARFAAFREGSGADPALAALTTGEARTWVVALQASGLAPVSVAGFVRGLKAISAWWAAEAFLAEDPLRRLARSTGPCEAPDRDAQPKASSERPPRRGPRQRPRTACLLTATPPGSVADPRARSAPAPTAAGRASAHRAAVPLDSRHRRAPAGPPAHGRAPSRSFAPRVHHLFLGRDGRPLSAAAIQHVLRRLGRRAGLAGVRTNPHTFRQHPSPKSTCSTAATCSACSASWATPPWTWSAAT